MLRAAQSPFQIPMALELLRRRECKDPGHGNGVDLDHHPEQGAGGGGSREWASGSQTCMGKRPALRQNRKKNDKLPGNDGMQLGAGQRRQQRPCSDNR